MEATRYYFKYRREILIIDACAMVLVVGIIDDITGHRVRLAFLYIIPVLLIAWWLGRRLGIYMSILSAVAWFIVDFRSELSYPLHAHFLNTMVRLAFLIFVAYGISLYTMARHRQEELTNFIIHDLKSPLTNIIMGLRAIEDNPDSEKVREMAKIASISSSRMLALIGSLTDTAKLEGGNMKLNTGETEVAGLIDRAANTVSLWAKNSNVGIEKHIDVSEKHINTDATLVDRILTNLLSNAIKASPANSTVTVRAVDAKDGMISFSVIDQGPGIPEKWANKIFDKFHQVEAKKDGTYIGSGLGLTFCKLAVEALGGKIKVDSEQGTGAVFTFTIPVE